ncbi:hypothetical protein C3L33_13116, partial [Rhododendron williamsianum]
MEEAKIFTNKHLKGIKGKIMDKDLMEQIDHALEMPLHHRMFRLEARWYIEAYGKRNDANHLLLEMANLDFNMAELERGESVNSILCYMRETGLSEQEARKHIRKLIDEAWKKMNKERVAVDSPFEKPFIETAINLARMSQCSYQNGDGLGALDNQAKNWVLSVIIEPITTSC